MMLYERGSEQDDISGAELREALFCALKMLGKRRRVLAVPPDATRIHSRAGELTRYIFEYYGSALDAILPAIGTHAPMDTGAIKRMFGDLPVPLFKPHDWRKGIRTLGTVPGGFLREVSEGKVEYGWPAQVDTLISGGGHDLILSIGQVVPHEVVGMANYNKNIFVGTGGQEGINKSHFLGAVYGMERIMGRADTPVRKVLNYASDHFGKELPVVYVMTVVSADEDGALKVRGLYIGDDVEAFNKAAGLSLKVNFKMMEKPFRKVVVYLDEHEFRSTWLGNKSIYRTRMAMADGGELVVLAPGVKEFGEDPEIDRLIRKYGYSGTDRVLEEVGRNEDLRSNLSAAAHLIHGSSEGRFGITYCPGKLTGEEVRGVKFNYAPLDRMLSIYDPSKLKDGWNVMEDGSEIYYISNPALGLWAVRARFGE